MSNISAHRLASADRRGGGRADDPVTERRARVFFRLVVAFGCALALWAWSVPGTDFPVLLASGVLLAASGLTWFVLVTVAVGRGWQRWRWLAVAPALVISVGVVMSADLPLRARWVASRSAFDHAARVAHPALASSTPGSRGQQIGGYRITHVASGGCGLLFYEAHGDVFGRAGFAYCPTRPAGSTSDEASSGLRYRPLGDGWYAFNESSF